MASPLSTTGYRHGYYSSQPLFLNTSEDLLFAGNGNCFRTDALKYAGKLVLASPKLISMRQSNTTDEALMLTTTNGNYDASAQSYGAGIYHSANSNVIALVQMGSSASTDATLSYFRVTR